MNRDNEPHHARTARRFVYRAIEANSPDIHPLRRATDTPPFRAVAEQVDPNTVMLKFRVYMKLN